MQHKNFLHLINLSQNLKILGLSFALVCSTAIASPSFAQDESALPPGLEVDAYEEGAPSDPFSFDDTGLDFEKSTEEIEDSFRKEAFQKALNKLMPLKPDEIRTLLEHYDRTVESTELPVHPYPRPELVVQNISLDPGVTPLAVKMSWGYVTTLSFLDSSGQPWPIEEISWVGNFTIQESGVHAHNHVLRISPEAKLAHGNISIRLLGLNAPVIMTFETSRDVVHYRFDAVVPKRGPGAKTPLIDRGVSLTAGDADMSIALGGVVPEDADVLDVSGVDGRTSAYVYNGLTYVRTPLTLLSPGWHSSVTSADGTRVYALDESPVILLSDRGRMVRAHLTQREEILK
ncbi:MAG: DotH/IcmK family type IV secretion protein [Alphaproteobacteria bacterium]